MCRPLRRAWDLHRRETDLLTGSLREAKEASLFDVAPRGIPELLAEFKGISGSIGQVAAYLETHPDGGHGRLIAFLQDEPVDLWDASDVMKYTGWGRPYISTLCSTGKLPHIPGRPTKFVPGELRKAVERLQVGGEYGRRKGKGLKPKK